MCSARNTSGALTLLLSVDAKFVNNFQKNIQYFNILYNIAPRYREGVLQPIMGNAQLFLQPQILPHKEH
jgi:hypothetical protein